MSGELSERIPCGCDGTPHYLSSACGRTRGFFEPDDDSRDAAEELPGWIDALLTGQATA